MEKITDEMRKQLREPLPQEAVSQHPTKTYLSSIKSIYVAERINTVFGVGSWTLKGEVIERIEKFVVVKAILEIPGYGFYGEAYGGNDNADIGDAYKGATTDGFTKICGQQLEIGIDVFKGLQDGKTRATTKPSLEATKSKSSTTKAGSSVIDMDWLKDSLKILQDKGIKAYSNANVLSYLNAIIGEKSESISEAVSKLNQDQARAFEAKVQEALK